MRASESRGMAQAHWPQFALLIEVTYGGRHNSLTQEQMVTECSKLVVVVDHKTSDTRSAFKIKRSKVKLTT